MKKITIGIALVLTLVMATSAVWAWDFSDHVKMAPTGKGDLLIFPFYAALPGGWETKINVINTALDRSVVAKVVIRSQVNSVELLDFLIYLSPTDVWNAVIRVNAQGQIELTSSDDSCLATINTWATAAAPFRATINNPANCSPPDTSSLGYIEVIEAAHSTALGVGLNAQSGGVNVSLNTPPVPKWAIYNAYQAASPTSANMVTDGINVLAGYMEFRNLAQGHNTVIPATVFRDYDATLAGGARLTVVSETLLGEANSWNSIGEIEAALSKNMLAMPYSTGANGTAMTVHLFTFPTKLTRFGAAPNQCTQRFSNSPYFRAPNAFCVPFAANDYDLSENSRTGGIITSPATPQQMCNEVNLYSTFNYPEGWTNYNFTQSNTAFDIQKAPIVNPEGLYDGAPVIGTVLNLVGTGVLNDGYWSLGAAYTDGFVRANSVPVVNYYYYQYQDETNTGTVSATGTAGYDIDLPDQPAINAEDQSRPRRYTNTNTRFAGTPEAADLQKPTQPAVADSPF